MSQEAEDILAMSDEEFLEKELELTPETVEDDLPEEEELEEPSSEDVEEDEEEENADEEEVEVEEDSQEPQDTFSEDTSSSASTEEGVSESADVDYEEFYKSIMAPFKANGKNVELRSPEEAIQLMQMGANYTKKMQAIKPYQKVLLMLERNNLMDEGKLSYLIDLDKKNPEAIHKLLKDSGIDPLDIDTDSETTYVQGNHRVSDSEAALVSAVEEVRNLPGGEETLQEITSKWDQASKEVLWSDPELLSIIHSHRQSGIYDQVANEVNRQRTIGMIPAGTSFVSAYQSIGDQMNAAGAFNVNSTPSATARTLGKPKSKVTNNRQAAAASSTRSTPTKKKEFINPLEMSDEDFLKQFEGRL